jgi:hypothetical protein
VRALGGDLLPIAREQHSAQRQRRQQGEEPAARAPLAKARTRVSNCRGSKMTPPRGCTERWRESSLRQSARQSHEI